MVSDLSSRSWPFGGFLRMIVLVGVWHMGGPTGVEVLTETLNPKTQHLKQLETMMLTALKPGVPCKKTAEDSLDSIRAAHFKV